MNNREGNMAMHRRGDERTVGLFVLVATLLLTYVAAALQGERFDDRVRDFFFAGFEGISMRCNGEWRSSQIRWQPSRITRKHWSGRRRAGDLPGVFCTSGSERGSHEGGSWTCRSESTKQSRL